MDILIQIILGALSLMVLLAAVVVFRRPAKRKRQSVRYRCYVDMG